MSIKAQLIINCYVLILKSFDKMISNFSDSICYATRINSIEDADHICNGVKPQSFVFVCTEHLKCPTKIFGIGQNVPPALSYKLITSSSQLSFEKQCRPTSLGWVSKICTIGLLQRTCKYLCQCKVTLSIRSRYSDFDITPCFLYIISGVRNLNNGQCFVKSVNNRVRGLSSPWIVGPYPWIICPYFVMQSVYCQ